MKHLKQIILAAALAALGGSAFAGSTSTTINIGGEIGAGCTVSADTLAMGQINSFDYYMTAPVSLGVNVNCSSGTAYSLAINTDSMTTNTGSLVLGLSNGTQAKANGANFPVAGAGTGIEQHYGVTGMQLYVRSIDGSSPADPTGGVVNATFAGVFTVTY